MILDMIFTGRWILPRCRGIEAVPFLTFFYHCVLSVFNSVRVMKENLSCPNILSCSQTAASRLFIERFTRRRRQTKGGHQLCQQDKRFTSPSRREAAPSVTAVLHFKTCSDDLFILNTSSTITGLQEEMNYFTMWPDNSSLGQPITVKVRNLQHEFNASKPPTAQSHFCHSARSPAGFFHTEDLLISPHQFLYLISGLFPPLI